MKTSVSQIDDWLQRLLSRLPVGWRLAIAVLVLLAPLSVLGYLYVQSKNAAIQAALLEREGIEYLQPLGQFMRHLAQHRGLVNVYLHGNQAMLPQIREVAAQVDRDLARVEEQDARSGAILGTQVRLGGIKAVWTKLKDVARDMPPQDSFAIHSALIIEALTLNEQVARVSTAGIILDPRAETYYLMDVIALRGADFAERVGQLRGYASGLVQKGRPDQIERIEVAIQAAGVSQQFEAIKVSLARAYHHMPALRAEIEPGVQAAEGRLNAFLTYADRLSRQGKVDISAPQMFDAGTAALDEYNKLNVAVDGILRRVLRAAIAELERNQLATVALVLATVALSLLFAYLSVRSVTSPIRRMVRVVDKLARGDNDARARLGTHDEMGALARHFDAMMDERNRSEKQLAYLAQYDTLTGLPNRHMLHDRLNQTLAQARRQGGLVGCMFVDLDRFKNVNDTYGHGVGDKLLTQAAERLRQCVRSADLVGRLGGDEFAVVLASLARAEDAGLVAQKAIASLSEPFELDGHQTYISASVGIAIFPGDGEDADELLRNADTAMYRAKELERGNHQFYLAQMNERAELRLRLDADLRGALERGEFLLHYQPKVELVSGAISGFEALLRWKHPQRGLVSPLEFVPILEENGMIVAVGEWVLACVCRQIKAWQAQGIVPAPIAINVSARQFQQQHLDAFIARIGASGVDPALLKLELTESLLMKDAEGTARALTSLKASGVRLSVDDFGTGYSSLAYLKRFPLDELKIDRAFIRDVTTDPEDAEITLAIISLAHSLKLKVVAEGVETAAQLAFLRAHGCDEMQGYYFARPLAIEDCTQALREGRHLQLSSIDESQGDRPALLIVDDNPYDLELMHKALEPGGYRILDAASPKAAFELLTHNRVNIVISDHNMPGMTGVEFLASVRQIYPQAIRIVLSGTGDVGSVTDAINEAGIHKYLSKDWDAVRLRTEVRSAYLRHGATAA